MSEQRPWSRRLLLFRYPILPRDKTWTSGDQCQGEHWATADVIQSALFLLTHPTQALPPGKVLCRIVSIGSWLLRARQEQGSTCIQLPWFAVHQMRAINARLFRCQTAMCVLRLVSHLFQIDTFDRQTFHGATAVLFLKNLIDFHQMNVFIKDMRFGKFLRS